MSSVLFPLPDRQALRALVVGAGISGIRAALDLAEAGYRVTLVDRAPHTGGILSKLDFQFPTDGCGMCKMLPLIDRDRASEYCLRRGFFHENIDLLLGAEITSIEGEAGDFTVNVRQVPLKVDPGSCIGCGLCVDACPVEVPWEFNEGLDKRRAIYLPVPHSIPNRYVIDGSACTRCGECEKACPTGAIDLGRGERREFRILVVDDEPIVRESLKDWLLSEGYMADTAGSAEAAMEKIEREEFHLMLADIKMPGTDGVELLRRAKDARPAMEVIMMTAYATVETAVEAMKIGATDYLIKPFDPESMIPQIAGIYTRRSRKAGMSWWRRGP